MIQKTPPAVRKPWLLGALLGAIHRSAPAAFQQRTKRVGRERDELPKHLQIHAMHLAKEKRHRRLRRNVRNALAMGLLPKHPHHHHQAA